VSGLSVVVGPLTPRDDPHPDLHDQAHRPAQHAEAPRQREDREAHILPEEQQRRLLPAQRAELDVVPLLPGGEEGELVVRAGRVRPGLGVDVLGACGLLGVLVAEENLLALRSARGLAKVRTILDGGYCRPRRAYKAPQVCGTVHASDIGCPHRCVAARTHASCRSYARRRHARGGGVGSRVARVVVV
jgi:hypothetical protein